MIIFKTFLNEWWSEIVLTLKSIKTRNFTKDQHFSDSKGCDLTLIQAWVKVNEIAKTENSLTARK